MKLCKNYLGKIFLLSGWIIKIMKIMKMERQRSKNQKNQHQKFYLYKKTLKVQNAQVALLDYATDRKYIPGKLYLGK